MRLNILKKKKTIDGERVCVVVCESEYDLIKLVKKNFHFQRLDADYVLFLFCAVLSTFVHDNISGVI